MPHRHAGARRRRVLSAAIVLAIAILPDVSAAPRRAERPIAQRAAAGALTAPELSPEIAHRIARQRLIAALGYDWNEVALETAPSVTIDTVLTRHGGSWRAKGGGRDVLKAPPNRDKFDWYLGLESDDLVAEVQANWKARHPGCRQMSIDVLESGAGFSDLSAQPALEVSQVRRMPADGIVVAVVDSGVAAETELAPSLLPGIDVLRPRQGNGPAPADQPSIDPADSKAWDANGHGTAMASLIASLATGARILPVRVVGDDCEGSVFDLAEGIRAATAAGANIINVSLSVEHDSPLLRSAVLDAQAQGVLVVAAAGNAGVIEYPAALPGVLAVTAVDARGLVPAFAPRGTRIDLAAPGVAIVSLLPGGEHAALTGTSPSTALVSACAAIAAGAFPNATSDELRAIVASAVPAPGSEGASTEYGIGGGVLDMSRLPAP